MATDLDARLENMTADEAEDFLDQDTYVAKCRHGHYCCSTEPGGLCIDDVLAKFPELG